MWITPCKPQAQLGESKQAQHGINRPPHQNCIAVQLLTELKERCAVVHELRLRLVRGYQNFTSSVLELQNYGIPCVNFATTPVCDMFFLNRYR
jgi:hypothetical protein